jgi:hypothetical protein
MQKDTPKSSIGSILASTFVVWVVVIVLLWIKNTHNILSYLSTTTVLLMQTTWDWERYVYYYIVI